MDFKILTAYPWWFFILCILFGLLTTALLYFYQNKSEFTKPVKWSLVSLRFISSTLIAFLLLSPMIRTIKRNTVKPTIVIGVDNSASIRMNSDSAYFKSKYVSDIQKIRDELQKDYNVEIYNFGDKIRKSDNADFKDEVTDISSLFKEVNTRYFNRNIGAVILASDGIYNSGADPLYEVRKSKYPVYTINLGDTTVKKDLKIQRVLNNKTTFKGNRFPVEITVHALQSPGARSVVRISQGTSVLFTQELVVSGNNQVITIPAMLEAKEAGLIKLRISVDEISGEINTANNYRDIFIEVKENKMKVAIVSEAPHPDIAALERVIENSNNFEVEVFTSRDFNKNPQLYNLIVLNQLPSASNPYTDQVNNIIRSKTPLLLIIGSQSNIQQINGLDLGITMVNFKGSYNEALPVLNQNFSLFLYSEGQKKLIENLPPLVSPFASYNVAKSVNVFLKQAIGSTTTEMPLIMFNETIDRRTCVITGEGIWKWRIFDYVQNSSHDNFDELFGKMFIYLTAQADKGRFRVNWNNFYAENENIEFSAILYNESFEAVTEPQVTIEITDQQKRKFNYSFSAEDEKYSLKIGNFTPGIYTFEAKANAPDQVFTKNGSFVVTDVKLEDINLIANHKLLNLMASESGGKSFSQNDFKALPEQLMTNENVKPIIYTNRNYMDLIDYFPIMILIFLLLGIEWFLRKYMGSY